MKLLTALWNIIRSLLGLDTRRQDGGGGPSVPTPSAPQDGGGTPPEPPAAECREAASLNDLLRIRAASRTRIEAVNGNLGTALGFKWSGGQRTDHPCIIIFVPQKLGIEEVQGSQRAPDRLDGPDGLWCLTDVVTGGKARREDVRPTPDLTAQNRQVVAQLRSGDVGLIGGIQLAFYGDGIEDGAHRFVGTAGTAVRHTDGQRSGLLTNQHVAEEPGRVIFHPNHDESRIGATAQTIVRAPDERWYDGVIDESHSFVRCDCAFVEVDDDVVSQLQPGVHTIGPAGPLLRTDPNTMDVIGQRVVSVGRTRGVQRGTVAGYSYEWFDGDESVYTDFLIIGEEGTAFSDKGDSGKLVLTDDSEHCPLGLLWGGWQERLREGREQEKWTYAVDLGKVLDRLGLELLT